MARSRLVSTSTKNLIYSILGIGLGVLILFGGISKWADPADCGGEEMYQGDTCEVTQQDGSTSDNGIEQQEHANHVEAILMFVGGPLITIGSGFWLRGEIRSRQRRNALMSGRGVVSGAGPFPGAGQGAGWNYEPAQGTNQSAYAVGARQGNVAPQQQSGGGAGAGPRAGPGAGPGTGAATRSGASARPRSRSGHKSRPEYRRAAAVK